MFKNVATETKSKQKRGAELGAKALTGIGSELTPEAKIEAQKKEDSKTCVIF